MTKRNNFKQGNPARKNGERYEIMANVSPLIGLAIIVLLGIFFLAPLSTQQNFNVVLTGNNENAVVSNIGFSDINKPIINLFSRTNPQGTFNLQITIKNVAGAVITNSTLYNLGLGESNFPVSGTPFKGNLTIEYSLYYNNKMINQNIITKEVFSNAR